MIVTGRDLYGYGTAEEFRAWVAAMPSMRATLLGFGLRDVPAVDVDEAAAPAVAVVNQGRWVADCPEPSCGGALAVVPGVPFLCVACLNVGAGFRWRAVAWPDERAQIEAVLDVRPLPVNRNWRPGETVAALVLENVEHGIEA